MTDGNRVLREIWSFSAPPDVIVRRVCLQVFECRRATSPVNTGVLRPKWPACAHYLRNSGMAFPLQRENILALTSRRLLVFEPVRGSASLLVPGRPGEPLFEIDRRNVVRIKPGKRRRLMKTVVVEFSDGSSIGLTTLKGADRLLLCDDDDITFAADAEMEARSDLAEEFFTATNPEMTPWVSDQATWFDFDYLDEAELHTAVQKHYGVDFDDETLRQPFWKFLDYLEANRTIRNQQESG
jgi:hypothetical protein